MPIERGNVGDENEKKPSMNNESKPDIDQTLLQNTIRELTERLSKIESKNNSGGGFDVDALAKAIRDGNKTEIDKFGTGKFVRPEDIDKSDYMEVGVDFFGYSVGYVIVDDKRMGHDVSTPFNNVIKFNYQASVRIKNGRNEDINNFSSYTSHSKKEVEWLREHSFYGVVFFEKTSQALNTDGFKAQKLVRHITTINNWDQHTVIQRCKERKVAITGDLKEMRIALAQILAEEDMVAEKQLNRQKATVNFEERMKLGMA